MSNLKKLNTEYKDWIISISQQFKASQIKAVVKVNSEMLKFFWFLGKELVEKKSQYDWGSNFYVQVSKDLSNTLSDIKSFSPRNLLYMVQFYKMYSNTVIAHQLGA